MDKENRERSGRRDRAQQGQDVTAGKGRRDEVGKNGIYPSSGPFPEGESPSTLTPGEINTPRTRKSSEVHRSDELKGAERFPRKGDDE